MTKQECKNLPPETPVQRNDGCDGRILACGITEIRFDNCYFIPCYYSEPGISKTKWLITQWDYYKVMSESEFFLWKLEN